jgi:cytochrome c553
MHVATYAADSPPAAKGNQKSTRDDQRLLAQGLAAANAGAGKDKADDWRCQECHGTDGNANSNANDGGNGAAARDARLAGQYAEYIVKQVWDFRSGKRTHDFMSIVAKNIDDGDLFDIAAYYAGKERMHGTDPSSDDNPVGKNLYVSGDATRNILPCGACHGVTVAAAGVPRFPVIAGQKPLYLEKQLRDWRSGERHNSADGMMNKIARSLTDAEIRSLADYICRLP